MLAMFINIVIIYRNIVSMDNKCERIKEELEAKVSLRSSCHWWGSRRINPGVTPYVDYGA